MERNGPRYAPTSATSKAAADAVEGKVTQQQQRVLNYLRSLPGNIGATDDAIETDLNLINGGRARRFELVKKGLVIDSGTTRLTDQGQQATVWKLAPEGHVYVPPPSMPTPKECALALYDLRAMRAIAVRQGYEYQHREALQKLSAWLKHRASKAKG